ncbi:MAG: tetratricopeptide repeat protein [Proteobacteria bacterium]|nr:tetratricopeptide repeat protein [Pseudomonadota bacterium]
MKRLIFTLLFLLPVLLVASESEDFGVAVQQMNDGFYSQSTSTFETLYNSSKSPEIKEKSLLLLGECYLRSQKLDSALRIFKTYLNDYPSGKFIAFAYSRIGVIHMKKGSYSHAVKYLQKAYRFKNVAYGNEIAVNLAECYAKLGNVKNGINLLINRIKISKGDNEPLYMKLAELYKMQGNDKKALSAVKVILANSKSDYLNKAYYIAGDIYFSYGDYDKSVNYLNKNLLSNNDYKYPSTYLLGEIYTVTGNYYTANKMFNRLLKNAKYRETGMFGMAWLNYQKGGYTTALSYLNNISDRSNFADRKIFYAALCNKQLNNDSLFLALSDSLTRTTQSNELIKKIEFEKFDYYLSKGNKTGIKIQFKKLSKISNAYYKFALADYEYKIGKYNSALINYRTLLGSREITEYTGSIKYHIILSFFKIKQYGKALEYTKMWWNSLSYYRDELTLLKDDILLKENKYKRSLMLLNNYYPGAREPYKELSLRAIAWTYMKMKDYKNAYIYFKIFVNNYTESIYYNEALLELGNCAYNTGKKDEALLYYGKIKGKKEIQKALFRQGKVLYEKGDYNSAIHMLKSFVNKYPANTVADDALYYVSLAFYNTNKPDSAKYYSNKLLSQYKNSDKYYDALLLLGDVSYNTGKYQRMLDYYSGVINSDTDTTHVKHALNTIVDYFVSTGKKENISSYFQNNFSQTLRKKQLYNIFLANYTLERGMPKVASYFFDNITSSKYNDYKNFLKGKLYISEGDTLKGINTIKSIDKKYASFEIITHYYGNYEYDSLLRYTKKYEMEVGKTDRIAFLKTYALFWLNKGLPEMNIHTKPYQSRFVIMKMIQTYEKNKNINLINDALKYASNDDPFTKAYALYLAGKIKFDSGNYNDALGYLLKIKYIYDRADISLKALSVASKSIETEDSPEKKRIREEIKKYEKILGY